MWLDMVLGEAFAMTEATIPFAPLQQSSSDALAGAGACAQNVVLDALGVLRRRPGISRWSSAPDSPIHIIPGQNDGRPVTGLYETLDGQLLAWTEAPLNDGSENYVSQVRTVDHNASRWLATVSAGMRPNRAQTTETELLVLFTLGGELWRIELKNNYAVRRIGEGAQGDTNTPFCTHVVHHSGRLLANDQRFDLGVRYSEPTVSNTDFTPHTRWDPTLFGGSGYLSAETSPDRVSALATVEDAVLVFGATTLQLFVPDPTLRFAPAGTIGVGIGAPFSLIRDATELYWMDNRRRIVHWGASGSVESISDAIQPELNGISGIADAFGYQFTDRGVKLLVWTFPSDGRTFVYQVGAGWGQWGTRRSLPAAAMGQFRANAAYARQLGSETLVGTLGGRVGKLDWDAVDDRGEGGIMLRCETGYQDHKTASTKACDGVTLVLRRGVSTVEGYASEVAIGYRDRPGPWVARIPVSLGYGGDSEAVVHLGQMGCYQRRQWFFEYSGTEQLALVSATESFTVL